MWAYSNCDEVEIIANGKKLGRKAMPVNGHLSWTATYSPGTLKAIGYRNGKKVIEKKIETTDAAARTTLSADRNVIAADSRDVAVFTVEVRDSKGRFVPDANIDIDVELQGAGRILGYGNGDPAGQDAERPESPWSARLRTFNGLAQVLVQSTSDAGDISLTVSSPGIIPSDHTITSEVIIPNQSSQGRRHMRR